MAQYDLISDGFHVVNGIVAKADAFATSGVTDRINLANYRRCTFLIHTGNATAGTANGTVTLNAFAAASGGSGTALTFKYRVSASSTTVDTWGALTDATTSGFSMTAADNYMYLVTITADDLVGQIDGKPFVELTVTEVTNDPIDASVAVILDGARYGAQVPVTAIA
ncbi:MAG: hypothetical protein VW239_03030 [Candidatus Nanopelagicales bacterium]